MFNKRRSEIQIIEDILDISQNGARKTEILYKGNMSFLQLNNYLSYLIEKDIISEDIVSIGNGSTSKMYTTTEKGKNLLEDITKVFTYLND